MCILRTSKNYQASTLNDFGKKRAEKILSSPIKTERKVDTFKLHGIVTFGFNHIIKMSTVVTVCWKFNKNLSRY